MPINLVSSNFTDIYNIQYSRFTANAGDRITCEFTILEDTSIITTPSIIVNFNTLIKTITLQSQSVSFIKEGFRTGDNFTFIEFDANDKVSHIATNLNVDSVTDTEMVYGGSLGKVIHGIPGNGYTWLIFKTDTRKGFTTNVNFIQDNNNTTTPTLGSLIDGEETKMSLGVGFTLDSVLINTTQPLYVNGKKSGNFEISSASIRRLSNITKIPTATVFQTRRFVIKFDVVNPNILFKDKFKGTNCLKLATSFRFANDVNDTTPVELYYNNNANTGWFDEAYNSDTELSELISVVMPTLYYNVGSADAIPFTFEVKNFDLSTYPGFQIGASYVTLSDYNKSKKDDQSKLLKYELLPYTYNDNLPILMATNSVASVKITTVTNTAMGGGVMSSVVNGEIYFTPTNTTFFDSKSESERRIIIWVKSANVNHILFDGFLQKKMPVGKQITNVTSYYTEENDNDSYADITKTPINSLSLFSGNIQDNINLFSDFRLSKTDVNTSVIGKIVARNSAGDEFTLDEMKFDLTKQDWNIWGTLTTDRQYNLPSASSKKIGFLKQIANIDANTKSIRLSYPVMNNWRYWLIQDNASNIFLNAGVNNKNWSNYSLNSYGYATYFKLEIERNGVFDFNYSLIDIWDYDQTGVFTSNIELFDADTNAQMTTIVLGKRIRIKATHIYNIPFVNPGWGDIMIERTESNPAWLLSSVVPYQTNTQNPLYPITGNTLTYTIVNATTRTLECLLDTSKLAGNSFTITSKICDSAIVVGPPANFKITESGIDKITENLDNKIIE